MKKAKLILIAICTIALFGGASAIKATRTLNQFYKTTLLGGACTVPTFVLYTTAPQSGKPTILQNMYYSTAVAAPCPTLRIYSAL